MINRLLDIIWPRNCAICERPVDRPGRHICSECINKLPLLSASGCCSLCGRAVEKVEHNFICEECRKTRPSFDAAISAMAFDEEARNLILGFKFKQKIWLLNDLADLLEGALRARFEYEKVDVIVPMPITYFHRIDRGYNQCEYLAKVLSKKIDRALDTRVLMRQGNPKRQADLDENARKENVVNTFTVSYPERVRGRTILLVDDIMTTGSTLSEAASTLKRAGAYRVWCVTLARSLRQC